jgi:AcrR family transcriptional regulator
VATGVRNRTYYAGDLRRDLLDTALAVVVEAGPAALSLRDLARRLGVSHAAPANHFLDKRALFTALATEAHVLLGQEMAEAVANAPSGDPLARLAATGRAYLAFAREHPGHFVVMWQEDMQDRADPALATAAASTFSTLVTLAHEVRGGVLSDQDPVTVALFAWSFAHGIADLSAGGALNDLPGAQDPAARDERLVDLLLAVLRGGGTG